MSFNILTYLLLWWIWSVLYRVWWKLNKINPIYGIVIFGISITLLWLLFMFVTNTKFTNPFVSWSSIWWILIMALWSILWTIMLMYAMQDNISVSTFLPMYQITSLIMVTIVGILFFKEKMSLHQLLWIILSFIAIWLIMKK